MRNKPHINRTISAKPLVECFISAAKVSQSPSGNTIRPINALIWLYYLACLLEYLTDGHFQTVSCCETWEFYVDNVHKYANEFKAAVKQYSHTTNIVDDVTVLLPLPEKAYIIIIALCCLHSLPVVYCMNIRDI